LLLSGRWQLSPTPVVRFASLWIDKITIRSLIFCHAGFTIQTLIIFIL
jgi:hypothetical protein